MPTSLRNLPTTLTSFAFQQEYFGEMESMLATVSEHHPDWSILVGRGTPSETGEAVFEVSAGTEPLHWTLPVPLELSGGEDDWRKITRIKGWWINEVWKTLPPPADFRCNRLLWLDADGRLAAPLDIEVNPAEEVIAAPWWSDPSGPANDTITTGLLLMQGKPGSAVSRVLERWSLQCLTEIRRLRPSTRCWADSDQEVLTAVLGECRDREDYHLLKLDHDKYCGIPDKDGLPMEGALVDQWMMSAKMGRKGWRGDDWPPPESQRRHRSR